MVILEEEKVGRAIRVHRACVICEQTRAEPLFAFTYDFLRDVRGVPDEVLKQRGWHKDFTSTIVKCTDCGCIYVRDALLPDPAFHLEMAHRDETAALASAVTVQRDRDTQPNYFERDQENWIVRSLLLLATSETKTPLNFLDYGAGSGTVSATARAFGVGKVTAYDPFFPAYVQKQYDQTRHAGINCISDPSALNQFGPYHAVVFQSAIEHVMDPKLELKRIYQLMSSGGYLYVNNPVMPLENELAKLMAATKITKKDKINYYHPFHVNYFSAREFQGLLTDLGFEITNICFYAPYPWRTGLRKRSFLQAVKSMVRTTQNALRLPYDRHVFISRKP